MLNWIVFDTNCGHTRRWCREHLNLDKWRLVCIVWRNLTFRLFAIMTNNICTNTLRLNGRSTVIRMIEVWTAIMCKKEHKKFKTSLKGSVLMWTPVYVVRAGYIDVDLALFRFRHCGSSLNDIEFVVQFVHIDCTLQRKNRFHVNLVHRRQVGRNFWMRSMHRLVPQSPALVLY